MSVSVQDLLIAGLKHRLKVWVEANQWLLIGLASILAPALLVIHLPVSLLLTEEGETVNACLSILLVVHLVFAVSGLLLSPVPTELKWYLSCFNVEELVKSLCLVQLKYNPFFWGVWVLPLLVLWYLDEPFNFFEYFFWFSLFCTFQILSFFVLGILRYGQFYFAWRKPFFIKNARLVNRLLMALAIAIYCYALTTASLLIALRIVLGVGSALFLAFAINSILEDEAQVRFWMMIKSCSEGMIVIQEYLMGLLIVTPGALLIFVMNGFESVVYFLIYMLAAAVLALLSLKKNGRVILAPLLAVSGMMLMSLSYSAGTG
ncbi:hypothetical protein [Microbulbifer variabilis]|uniref:hypothetical protein n=1 Tax=Microbulbifer variabilis TaxID=266805 RepID=UPI001CFCB16B|nr:hypothetical protein [Microbulbifer variabilis]